MFNKRLMAVVVLVAVVCAVPSWGAQFKRKTITDQQFLDMCSEGDTQGVIEAIKAGVNVNAKDKDGWTALMMAACYGHAEVIKILLNAGAEVNAKADDGLTALMWTALKGHTEIINALIEAGSKSSRETNTVTQHSITLAQMKSSEARTHSNALRNSAGNTRKFFQEGYYDYSRENRKNWQCDS